MTQRKKIIRIDDCGYGWEDLYLAYYEALEKVPQEGEICVLRYGLFPLWCTRICARMRGGEGATTTRLSKYGSYQIGQTLIPKR